MNRRAFFRHFGGLIAAAAVAQGVVKKLTDTVTTFTTKEMVFDPCNYAGDWKIIVTQETWRFGDAVRVYHKSSPWVRLVQKSEFPAGIGETVKGVTKG